MRDCDESINATGTKKKRRRFGFRYSSQKVLDRSRLTRLAKAGGCEVTSVTRTLSYPSSVPSELCAGDIHAFALSPCDSPILVPIDESDEGRKEIGNVDHFNYSEYHEKVNSLQCLSLCLGFYYGYCQNAVVFGHKGMGYDTIGYVYFWTWIGIFSHCTARSLAIDAHHQALAFAFAPHKLTAPHGFILLLVYCLLGVLQIGFSLRIG
jgi:hypothetical protein